MTFGRIATGPVLPVHLVKNATLPLNPSALRFRHIVKLSSLLFVFLLPLAQASTQKKRDSSEPSDGSYRLRFGDQLGLSRDLQLCGSSDNRPLRFYGESRGKPVSGGRLHLFLEHTPNLDGDRSFLSVGLNYGILRSLRLDDHNEQRSEVVIPLPPESLKRENELVFSVTQFPRDPASSTPCTSIKLDSYIEIPNFAGESTLDLSLFPAPFVDTYSYRPQKVSLLVPNSTASTPTLQAIALMAANMRRQAGTQQLQFTLVRTIESADAPLLVLGTPQEQPELKRVLGPSHFLIEHGEEKVTAGAAGKELLGESEGLVGVAVAGRRVPTLFVTANSPAGVLTAVRQLLGGSTRPTGTIARISQATLARKKDPRDWVGFIPPSSRFRLFELTDREERLRTMVGQDSELHLDAPPDARFLDYGHEMNLVIKLAPGESPSQRLTVHLNDTLIGRFASQQIFSGTTASVMVEVPARLLGTRNVLKLGWEGDSQKDTGQAMTLLPNSDFYLPRVYRTELPDLGLLQHSLYPFSLHADLEDLAIVIPDAASADNIALLTEMACVLGRMAPSEFLNFQVRRIKEASRSEIAAFNIIALIPEIAGDSLHNLFGRWQPLPWIDSLKKFSRVQEQASPWNSGKWVLSLEATSVPALQEAVRLCFSTSTLKQLTGDSAVLLNTGPIPFSVVQKRTVEERLYLMRLEAWMREHWVAMPIVLTLVSAVLFVGLRVVLGNYRRAHPTGGSVQNTT